MARFSRDENGNYKYLIMSTLYHYAECHKKSTRAILAKNEVAKDDELFNQFGNDLFYQKRVKVYNKEVINFLREKVCKKKENYMTRTELNQLAQKMNCLAASFPADGISYSEKYEIRGRSSAAGIRIRCK